jgi:hypothetical protein
MAAGADSHINFVGLRFIFSEKTSRSVNSIRNQDGLYELGVKSRAVHACTQYFVGMSQCRRAVKFFVLRQ